MKFKLDENLPADAAKVLAEAGHDGATVLQEQLGGRPDSTIAEICKREQRALITLDTDFGNIQLYPPAEYDLKADAGRVFPVARDLGLVEVVAELLDRGRP